MFLKTEYFRDFLTNKKIDYFVKDMLKHFNHSS